MDLNTPHMPPDVPEELQADFTDILNRIPDGWGRWVSCDRGWYRLIVKTHRKLMKIDPNYEIHQVKEKYGGLRYYIGCKPSKSEQMDKIINKAEKKSFTICERCGADGTRTNISGYRVRTLCIPCS